MRPDTDRARAASQIFGRVAGAILVNLMAAQRVGAALGWVLIRGFFPVALAAPSASRGR